MQALLLCRCSKVQIWRRLSLKRQFVLLSSQEEGKCRTIRPTWGSTRVSQEAVWVEGKYEQGAFLWFLREWIRWSKEWRRPWHPTPVLLPGKFMDRGAWKAAVHGVAEGQTRLSSFTFTFIFCSRICNSK